MTLNRPRLEAILQTLQTPGIEADWDSQLQFSPGDFSLYLFDTVSSTNTTLWELIEAGALGGTVVIATQQTAGRGQWGRRWCSESGGLYLSWAVNPNLAVSNQAQLTVASAWGIATVLGDRQLPIQLKWPNDLMLEGRKLGGILTETRIDQGQITQAVVGVGLNWNNPVPEIGINLQTFFGNCPDLTPIQSLEMVAALVIQGLNYGWQTFSQTGIEALLPGYWELLGCRGRQVEVAGQVGVITGVNSQGELCVQMPSSAVPELVPGNITETYLKPGTINLGYG
ncbi:MAG: biotin--[acetyl-CoA-carboxylase] ligase [Oscillatoriales cyanobacterium RM1_1_9]|nr:biotin--[acetyl-CoA-carboxylase] ligase [Oscillatoriales cyanobacterium SM2_3_0]NJO46805.1 biotin--[acetyl-CoA-carboxylase] ligase [Oscillatoriales cyanobacterium RM2_1_1]NJO71416.1 biotin--[acetyl-CoA-carboxylase] ligase [Oscillatoriales cyanobacterium RM1_1_9]